MRRAWLSIPVLCIAIASAGAQWQLTGDAGAARLQQTGIPSSNALTAGAAAEGFGERTWLRSTALVALADANRATAQALVLGSLLGAPNHRARWELSGALSGFGETNAYPTTSGEGMAHVRFDRGERGGSLGFGAGAIAHRGETDGLFHAQGDAYWITGDDQWIATLSGVRVPSMITEQVVVQGSYLTLMSVRGVSYADGTVGWRHEHRTVTLGATAGIRAGVHGAENTGGWGTADATFWFSERSAVVLGAGRTLDDAIRGVPRTTFASVGLRIAARPHFVRGRVEEIHGARLTVVAAADGRHRIEVRGVEAMRVEVAGDFTGWQPVELERDGGVWRLERVLSSGLHRIVLRVDGGEWTSPANLPRARDDLGGVVGLITIP